MKEFAINFWNDEEGIEVIEILLILSVLIVVALMFKEAIMDWAESLFDKIKSEILNITD